jgi:hypothetical protein
MSDKFLRDQSLQIEEAFRQLKQQQEEENAFYWFLCFMIFCLAGIFFFFVYVGRYARRMKQLEVEKTLILEKKLK